MNKEQLKTVLASTPEEMIPVIDRIIVGFAPEPTGGDASRGRLQREFPGLVWLDINQLVSDGVLHYKHSRDCWSYAAGPISDFFALQQEALA
jgi:hypothetical protein